ncbi:unnamed protein product (mitochondrion) [Plasmodiophora brassicae]|uniref:Non-structural maintenance of chromosomes element 1 homolog n=1 Tax=Plasmodiophora brassicae TaxID=37360 RepID=A0A0G4J516_PLABS|nr:hypothetical protein PBRA_002597 [Plasmodiophora brassicae]SPQ94758.1 unnamed protein product [Plasmodiophora brassicae]
MDAVRRAFAQYFMTVGVARELHVKKEYKLILEMFASPASADGWKDAIGAINRDLQVMNMAIRASVSEVNGHVYWALATTSNDEIAKMSLHFDQKELEFFRAVVHAIIDAGGSLPKASILDLRQSSESAIMACRLSAQDVERVVNDLIMRRWLREDKDGNYLLGERTYIEMRPVFEQMCGEGRIPKCASCQRYCILASDRGMHFHCQDRMDRNDGRVQ